MASLIHEKFKNYVGSDYEESDWNAMVNLINQYGGRNDNYRNPEDIYRAIYDNNLIACEAFEKLNSKDENECYEIFKRLLEMVHYYCRESSSIPVQFKLNLLCNFSFWYMIKTPHIQDYLQNYLAALCQSLEHILATFGHFQQRGFEKNLAYALKLLKILSNHSDPVFPILSSQIFDVITVNLLILHDICLSGCMLQTCACTFQKVMNEMNLRDIRLQGNSEKLQRDSVKVPTDYGYFKFGFVKMNAFCNAHSYKISSSTMLLSTCTILIKASTFAEAMKAVNYSQGMNFQLHHSFFLYMKAVLFYKVCHFKDAVNALELLAGFSNIPEEFKSRIQMLRGIIHIKEEEWDEALEIFGKIKHAKDVALYYIAFANGKKGLVPAEISTLQSLLDLKKMGQDCLNGFDSMAPFHRVIMEILHPKPEISLADALYLHAKVNLTDALETSAESYSQFITELSGRTYKCDASCHFYGSMNCPNDNSGIVPFPPMHFIFYEAIIANTKVGNFAAAASHMETLSRINIRMVMKDSFDFKYRLGFLDDFKDDIILAVLGAEMLQKSGIPPKTMLSAFLKLYEYVKECLCRTYYDIKTRSFLKVLRSKLCVKLGLIYRKMGQEEEAKKYFLEAFYYNPENEVVFHFYMSQLTTDQNRSLSNCHLIHNVGVGIEIPQVEDVYVFKYVLTISEDLTAAENLEGMSSMALDDDSNPI